MLVTKLFQVLLTFIVFFVHTIEVNGTQISNILLCSTYKFEPTWGWVNEDQIFIFGSTVPLKFPVLSTVTEKKNWFQYPLNMSLGSLRNFRVERWMWSKETAGKNRLSLSKNTSQEFSPKHLLTNSRMWTTSRQTHIHLLATVSSSSASDGSLLQ